MLQYDTHSGFIKAPAFLCCVTILCLAPFLGKAFHIDDPTFIGMARYISSHPFDYFGYYMQLSPPVITNPPLVAYFIAFAGLFLGYGEMAMHAAFLLPACAVVVGTWFLARDLCARPLAAALVTLVTPVFLLSSTTVMCDVLMLSFWVFSIYFWKKGMHEKRRSQLLMASLLMTLCILTKYSGICLVPLLLAYSLAVRGKPIEWLLYVLLPVAALLLFDQMTYMKYGLRQLSYIESYSRYNQEATHKNLAASCVTGLSFLGGCLLVHCFYLLGAVKWMRVFLSIAGVCALLMVLIRLDLLDCYPLASTDGINWRFVFQLPFFVTAGASYLAITVFDLWRERDADSLLLFLWVTGVLAFTVFVNWSVNGRSILPIAPVAGIMVLRHLGNSGLQNPACRYRLYLPLLLSLTVALMVTYADFTLANSAREAAAVIHPAVTRLPGKVWVEGHWGFEHYTKSAGKVESLDYENPRLKKGDIVMIPGNNTNTKLLYKHLAAYKYEDTFEISKLVSTMNMSKGAGFYSDLLGPLPFAIGSTPEKYYIYEIIMDKSTRFTY